MLKEIITEEMGISNKVSLLTLKVKNMISDDFHKNFNDINCYTDIPILPNKNINVFHNVLTTKFENISINIYYIVYPSIVEKDKKIFTKKYKSDFNIEDKLIRLFLTLNSESGKIDWVVHGSTLQHEIEHLFQQHKSGKEIPIDEKYSDYLELMKGKTDAEKIVGYVYYYAQKYEENAIMNGLYRKIMECNKVGKIIDPIDVMKNDLTYNNINKIKKFISNIDKKDRRENITNILNSINKQYDSFIKLSDMVINEYIKKFGRTLFKAKKDINRLYNKHIY